jgi:hypothetical protein
LKIEVVVENNKKILNLLSQTTISCKQLLNLEEEQKRSAISTSGISRSSPSSGYKPEKGSSIAPFKIVNVIYSLHQWEECLQKRGKLRIEKGWIIFVQSRTPWAKEHKTRLKFLKIRNQLMKENMP